MQAVVGEERLERGRNGLQVYVMAEVASNVVLAPAFATRFDGFSIGSRDLTQLTLGVVRDHASTRDLRAFRSNAASIPSRSRPIV